MAVIIFVNGIRAVNGLVKSSINTANAFAEEGLDVHLINFVGNITGAEHLPPHSTYIPMSKPPAS